MKTLILVLTMFLTTTMTISAQTMPPLETGVSQTLAKWRAANYSDVRYKLNITLEKNAPLMRGEIEISVKLTDEAAKNDLILDWRTTQFANDKDKPYADVWAVNQVKFDVVGTGGKTINEHLIVSKKHLKSGENTIKINFASPIKTSGAAITRYVDKEDGAEYIYSLFVPSDASTAFPVFDQPDLKARFQLTVGAPEDWDVITNTDQFVTDNLDAKIFRETKPISTYLFAFAAGNFDVFVDGYSDSYRQFQKKNPSNEEFLKFLNSKKSRIYVRQSQAEKFKQHAAEVFRLNREGVKFLESYFDYKFPFPKYDLVLIPEFPFGGMEHAGATFLRETSVIFPTEPTKNDYVSRANVIFHEAAHQWFGDTVTMKWFDDLWLKEGFAEFMAYKALEKVMPEYNAWKIFYERNKQGAYLTDSTRGTTPIYQEIPNLSAAKSAYGNIVYRKAPSFLRQAEFYLGEKEFQTAVRSFLKKHEFANAEWTDLVKEFETASKKDLKDWANVWVKQKGVPKITALRHLDAAVYDDCDEIYTLKQVSDFGENIFWKMRIKTLISTKENTSIEYDGGKSIVDSKLETKKSEIYQRNNCGLTGKPAKFIFPNYQDYGYGIFLLDEKSRAYVLANIQTEKDDFLRAMMWGALWDSVREGELNPKDYVELVIKNFAPSPAFMRQTARDNRVENKNQTADGKPPEGGTQNYPETDESTIQTILGRVSTAMNYYLSDAQRETLTPQIEAILIDKMQNSATVGQRITFYRAFLNIASTEKARLVLHDILNEDFGIGGGNTKMRPGTATIGGKVVRAASPAIPLMPKDRADIIARLIIIGDSNALDLLKDYENSAYLDRERYAYAARAAVATKENKAKYWNDFTGDKNISESWIESAFVTFNSSRQSTLTLPYLEKALTELPNLKKNRKIFFVNGWLAAFIGGQKSEEALKIVNDFLAKHPNLDKDLRLKILENADGLERAVKIRAKFGNQPQK